MSPAKSSTNTVVALVGPTGSGKTALCLSLADRLNAEVVACDSRTVYRYMDIGTAKPSRQEQALVAHHMLDQVDPNETYTAIQYKEEGTKAVEGIIGRRRLPLVCGGTGFYARVLLEGLEVPPVPPQPELRASLKEQADTHGNEHLHQQLLKLDPTSAARINVNDRFRIVRALEVCLVSGQPFSTLASRKEPAFETIWIALGCENRSTLYDLIRRRLQIQLQSGMIEEVDSLLARFGPTQTLLSTINYREIAAYVQGRIDRRQAEDDCIQHNCQLARRQLIWFRANPQITWFAVDQLSAIELEDRVLSHLRTKLIE